jgi:hypothetical protein
MLIIANLMGRGHEHNFMAQSNMIADSNLRIQIKKAIYVDHNMITHIQPTANVAEPMHARCAHNNGAVPNANSSEAQ